MKLPAVNQLSNKLQKVAHFRALNRNVLYLSRVGSATQLRTRFEKKTGIDCRLKCIRTKLIVSCYGNLN